MKTTARLGLLVFIAVVGASGASHGQTSAGSIVVETPSGTFRIPREFLTSQVSATQNGLVRTNQAFAFQFEMPDGGPVSHDYGLEGLPDISDAETRYPVVVNGISFRASTETSFLPPEQQLANLIHGTASPGMDLTSLNGIAVLSPNGKSRWPFTYYYAQFLGVAQAPDSTGIFSCAIINHPPPVPSACSGDIRSPELNLTMHVRFPRLKVADVSSIYATALRILLSWKQ